MPDIFSFDLRRARKGDCFLVHYGTKSDPKLMLVDGGPSNVYQPQLKPRIAEIRAERKLAASTPLPIDLLMVSHIDDDHIKGILEMTRELVDAKNEKRPASCKIKELWHNAFEKLAGEKTPNLTQASVAAAFGPNFFTGPREGGCCNAHSLFALASVPQGGKLQSDARALNLPINSGFGEDLVKAGDDRTDGGLTLTVIGPLRKELDDLRKAFEEYNAKNDAAAAHVLAAYLDKSVANLSSIVVLATFKGKSMLLTGDARGDKVIEGLTQANLLDQNGKIHVDILKMPHHGSDRNLDDDFFETISADHYVLSGDGEHGNPERETFEMMIRAGLPGHALIHLTYPVSEIDHLRKEDWAEAQRKEMKKKERNPHQAVRKNWSGAMQSLASFFSKYPGLAPRVRTVREDAPHVIDLLDPLGF